MSNAETVTTESESAYEHRATYSPEDNKLRLYPSRRLDAEEYKRVKDHGFIWAAKQGLFVAPMWTPARFDLLTEICGEVEDEDTSLVNRAAERAERFDGYREKRAADASRAAQQVKNLSDGIPLGQPILVGHHSQRRAERDAQKIENGMRQAVKMWETSKYWTDRAAGAIAHAKYKEKPEVRARRIKKLGAEMRTHERDNNKAAACLTLWSTENLTLEKARKIAGCTEAGYLRLPKKEGDTGSQNPSAYDVLREEPYTIYAPRTLQEVIDQAKKAYPRRIAHNNRWIEHYQNRIAYETAMLNEQGAGELIAPKPRPKQLPICNYDGEVTVKRYSQTATYKMHHMTKAEYAEAVKRENTGCWEDVNKTHRVKVALIPQPEKPRYQWSFGPVFITDSKVTPPPAFAPDAAPVSLEVCHG